MDHHSFDNMGYSVIDHVDGFGEVLAAMSRTGISISYCLVSKIEDARLRSHSTDLNHSYGRYRLLHCPDLLAVSLETGNLAME